MPLIEIAEDSKPPEIESPVHWSFSEAHLFLDIQTYPSPPELDLSTKPRDKPNLPIECDWSPIWEFFERISGGKSAEERLGAWAWVLSYQPTQVNEEKSLMLRWSEEDTLAATTSEEENSGENTERSATPPAPVSRCQPPLTTPARPITTYFNSFTTPHPCVYNIRSVTYKTRTQKRRRIAHWLNVNFGTRLTKGHVYTDNIHTGLSVPKVVEGGIHVFVDCSNIVLGFIERLRINRNIPRAMHVAQPPFNFADFTLILERCRPTSKRVLVGSYTNGQKYPYHHEARYCGYEVNLLERVSKIRVPSAQRRVYSASGYASASDVLACSPRVSVEQGVDEILQLKMLESIVDTEKPTTIVLATGDAAVAEFSGGFLDNVRRALVKGWKVEIVAWRLGMSSAFTKEAEKWNGKLQIIYLDDMAEDLLAWYQPDSDDVDS